MSLCPYAYLRASLSGLLTAPDQGSLTTFGELFNISALDPLLPTLLIATLCLCVLLTILYYSLVVAWEVFWASRRSPSPLDPSAEVVLTGPTLRYQASRLSSVGKVSTDRQYKKFSSTDGEFFWTVGNLVLKIARPQVLGTTQW